MIKLFFIEGEELCSRANNINSRHMLLSIAFLFLCESATWCERPQSFSLHLDPDAIGCTYSCADCTYIDECLRRK